MRKSFGRFLAVVIPLLLSAKNQLNVFIQRHISFKFPTFISFLSSNKDFVLKISPLPKRYRHLAIRNYPPPGYGVPPGKAVEGRHKPSSHYGLFLYPARIAKSFLGLTALIYLCITPPIVLKVLSDDSLYSYLIGLIIILLLTAFTYYFTMHFLFSRMAPVFTDAWQLWPESQYNLFLTVPHVIKLSLKDKLKEKFLNKRIKKHKYWHPDKQTAMSHQSSEYLEGMHTVQEVLLNLGIFELFFHKNDETTTENKNELSNEYQSIKLNHWFIYYFSPIWISYFVLILTIAIYQAYPFKIGYYPLYDFPVNIIVAAFIWLVWSIVFVWKRIEYLRLLHKDVKKGVYQSHLELVPQKILSSITKIPHEQQILAGINHLQKVLHIVQIAAFTNIMLILEVLSNIPKQS